MRLRFIDASVAKTDAVFLSLCVIHWLHLTYLLWLYISKIGTHSHILKEWKTTKSTIETSQMAAVKPFGAEFVREKGGLGGLQQKFGVPDSYKNRGAYPHTRLGETTRPDLSTFL